MTQTTTTTSDTRFTQTGWDWQCNEYWEWVQFGVTSIVSNDIDQRIKPEDLVSNMTSMDRQSFLSQRNLVTKVQYDDYWSCGDGKPFYAVYSRPPDGLVTESQWTDVEIAVKNKVKDLRLNLASYVPEFNETVGMVKTAAGLVVDAARQVRRSLKHAKRGDLRKAFSGFRRNGDYTLGDVSGLYLLTTFGLEPIFNDMTKALTNLGPEFIHDMIVRVSARGVSSGSTSGGESGATTTNYNGFWETSERGVVYFTLKKDWTSYTYGNPLEAIWEGVPFSWIIDYFTNVGDYLTSLDAFDGVEIKGGCVTTRHTAYAQERVLSFNEYDSPGSQFVTYPGIGETLQPGLSRFAAQDRRLSIFEGDFQLDLSNSKGIRQLTNMVAVLHQLRRAR